MTQQPDKCRSAVKAAILDWFTLPPKYRTKKKLIELADGAFAMQPVDMSIGQVVRAKTSIPCISDDKFADAVRGHDEAPQR